MLLYYARVLGPTDEKRLRTKVWEAFNINFFLLLEPETYVDEAEFFFFFFCLPGVLNPGYMSCKLTSYILHRDDFRYWEILSSRVIYIVILLQIFLSPRTEIRELNQILATVRDWFLFQEYIFQKLLLDYSSIFCQNVSQFIATLIAIIFLTLTSIYLSKYNFYCAGLPHHLV